MEPVPNKLIRVAVVENDPLRFVGFRALFDGDSGFVLQSYTPSSIFNARGYDLVLIGARTGSTMYKIMAGLKGLNPSLRMIATGSGQGGEMALRALCAGAKGIIDESARAEEFKEDALSAWGRPSRITVAAFGRGGRVVTKAQGYVLSLLAQLCGSSIRRSPTTDPGR